MATLTITGDTYRGRDWLKEQGFSWDSVAKEWSVEYERVDDKIELPAAITTQAHYEHAVKCHCKGRGISFDWGC